VNRAEEDEETISAWSKRSRTPARVHPDQRAQRGEPGYL